MTKGNNPALALAHESAPPPLAAPPRLALYFWVLSHPDGPAGPNPGSCDFRHKHGSLPSITPEIGAAGPSSTPPPPQNPPPLPPPQITSGWVVRARQAPASGPQIIIIRSNLSLRVPHPRETPPPSSSPPTPSHLPPLPVPPSLFPARSLTLGGDAGQQRWGRDQGWQQPGGRSRPRGLIISFCPVSPTHTHAHTHTHSQPRFPPLLAANGGQPRPHPLSQQQPNSEHRQDGGGSARLPFNSSLAAPQDRALSPRTWLG